ncbi:hypothetical protein OUZ56_021378 [Daphnia magna]|uniref:Uncharacterized protein n=1 Tax=Daphnia magna TaxID=35525 RepID=A0ABQ9ZH93_9CRUS|nr:hypothetical protein OUZ56_021378 [Daphnia magna]
MRSLALAHVYWIQFPSECAACQFAATVSRALRSLWLDAFEQTCKIHPGPYGSRAAEFFKNCDRTNKDASDKEK